MTDQNVQLETSSSPSSRGLPQVTHVVVGGLGLCGAIARQPFETGAISRLPHVHVRVRGHSLGVCDGRWIRLARELRVISIRADEQDSCPRRDLVNQKIARNGAMSSQDLVGRCGHSLLPSNDDAVESVCNESEFYELQRLSKSGTDKTRHMAHSPCS